MFITLTRSEEKYKGAKVKLQPTFIGAIMEREGGSSILTWGNTRIEVAEMPDDIEWLASNHKSGKVKEVKPSKPVKSKVPLPEHLDGTRQGITMRLATALWRRIDINAVNNADVLLLEKSPLGEAITSLTLLQVSSPHFVGTPGMRLAAALSILMGESRVFVERQWLALHRKDHTGITRSGEALLEMVRSSSMNMRDPISRLNALVIGMWVFDSRNTDEAKVPPVTQHEIERTKREVSQFINTLMSQSSVPNKPKSYLEQFVSLDTHP